MSSKMTPLEDAIDMVERGFSLQPDEAKVLLAAYREALADAAKWKAVVDARDECERLAGIVMVQKFASLRRASGYTIEDFDYENSKIRLAEARKAVGK